MKTLSLALAGGALSEREGRYTMNSLALKSAAALLALGLSNVAAADDNHDHDDGKPAFTEITRVSGTIVDVAVGNSNFSTLVSALQAADLVTTLQGPGPFTVFAPTNDAFAKLPPGVLDFVLANSDALTDVLLYHVLPGKGDFRLQFRPRDIETVQGQDIFVDREEDELQINNAFVSGQVIQADNGLIYVIDSVLLPQYR